MNIILEFIIHNIFEILRIAGILMLIFTILFVCGCCKVSGQISRWEEERDNEGD